MAFFLIVVQQTVMYVCVCSCLLNPMWATSSVCVSVLSGNLRRAISDKNRRVLQTGSLQSTARIQLLTVYGEGRTDGQIMQICECCVCVCVCVCVC